MNNQQLTFKSLATILNVAPITVSRIAKNDEQFPQATKIGRSQFIDSDAFYKWLSKKAGYVVVDGDYLVTGKDLQNRFNKSHTWVWQNVKAGTLPKPFYIGRNTYWMNSKIEALFVSGVA